MHSLIPRTKRGADWVRFAEDVLSHIDNYTVPQYGDRGDDEIANWTEDDCILIMKKYLARFGKNSRRGQAALDMLKTAHYASFVYQKMRGDKDA